MVEPYDHVGELNPSQRAAAEYSTAGLPQELPGPLLIIAGAGTGKTNTLAHRVAHLIVRGADARRILLLTFTRRAAATMTRRAERIAAQIDLTSRPARGRAHSTRLPIACYASTRSPCGSIPRSRYWIGLTRPTC